MSYNIISSSIPKKNKSHAFTHPNNHWNRGSSDRKDPSGCSRSHLNPWIDASNATKAVRPDRVFPTRTNVYPLLPSGVRTDLPLVCRDLKWIKKWAGFAPKRLPLNAWMKIQIFHHSTSVPLTWIQIYTYVYIYVYTDDISKKSILSLSFRFGFSVQVGLTSTRCILERDRQSGARMTKLPGLHRRISLMTNLSGTSFHIPSKMRCRVKVALVFCWLSVFNQAVYIQTLLFVLYNLSHLSQDTARETTAAATTPTSHFWIMIQRIRFNLEMLPKHAKPAGRVRSNA